MKKIDLTIIYIYIYIFYILTSPVLYDRKDMHSIKTLCLYDDIYNVLCQIWEKVFDTIYVWISLNFVNTF